MNKKIEKKNEIIKKSINLMYLNGYNGTSVKDITDAAGIPKGSFYNYFKDKEQYVIDALDYYYTFINKEKFEILTNEKLEPLERIKGFFQKAIENMESSNYKYGCFLGNTAQELGDVNDHVAKEILFLNNKIIEAICKNLKEAKIKGDLKSLVPEEILGGFILSAWQGSLLRSKVSENKEPLNEFMKILIENLL